MVPLWHGVFHVCPNIFLCLEGADFKHMTAAPGPCVRDCPEKHKWRKGVDVDETHPPLLARSVQAVSTFP